VQRRLPLPERYDFGGTVGVLAMGRHDPCARVAEGSFWWATRTPIGPATLRLRRECTGPGGNGLIATGYGPGAEWVLDRASAIAGLGDDLAGFDKVAAQHPTVARLAHVHAGVRMPATGRVFQRLLRTIFEQKVTGKEAYRAYAATVRHFHRANGEPAPGPLPGLLLPPDPVEVAVTPYWVFHPFGVDQRRADTIRRAAAVAARLDACTDSAEATRRLTAIPGVGAWTAAEVVRIAFGDPDAVSVGDYHIPHMVAWALAGEPRAGGRSGPSAEADARMLDLLEPFRGHRGRVCNLLEFAGLGAPRFGPRMPIRSFATF
jgi:3-methyladenine DNA glycosylase/8-oxoguanine DNA glycosylase